MIFGKDNVQKRSPAARTQPGFLSPSGAAGAGSRAKKTKSLTLLGKGYACLRGSLEALRGKPVINLLANLVLR